MNLRLLEINIVFFMLIILYAEKLFPIILFFLTK